ncbi:glycosyltransferase family 87 protein [Acidisoma silvae]|uniref:glycosyltransferase family 87 protein n=1 Tax=Acidisoma silvae TaxID=2802396 RepID=UPI001D0BAD7D|nr:glycosyltransferase family 87 protein [Acidisoma silvae]
MAAVTFGLIGFAVSDPQTLFWDFRSAYYPAGAAVLHGASLSPFIHKGIWGFVNLPAMAWLFAPFAVVSAKIAALLFTFTGICALAIAYLLMVDLARLTSIGRAWLLLAMSVNGPLIYSLKLGNTSHIVLAMLAGGLWLLRRKLVLLAGVLLGIAALVKLPLLLFGAYFLLRRNYLAAMGFFGLILAAFVVSVGIFGWGLHVQWYEDDIRTFNSHALAAFNVQSLQSFLVRLREPAPPLADWQLYVPLPEARYLALSGTLALLAFFFWCNVIPRREQDPTRAIERQNYEYLAVIVLCLISSPLSWTHYYCWLLLPAAFVIGQATRGGKLPWISVAGLMLATPLVLLLHPGSDGLAAFYEKAIVSIWLLGGIVLFVTLSLATRTADRLR